MQDIDEAFMVKALNQAHKAIKKNEVPIGAVIVKDNKIISRAYNQKEMKKDATKHAEIIAIQKASKKIQNWRLTDCTIYVTLKPCNMCTSAINQCRIKKVVIGTDYILGGSVESHKDGIEFGKNVEVKSGIMEEECKRILQEFFKKKRKESQ